MTIWEMEELHDTPFCWLSVFSSPFLHIASRTTKDYFYIKGKNITFFSLSPCGGFTLIHSKAPPCCPLTPLSQKRKVRKHDEKWLIGWKQFN